MSAARDLALGQLLDSLQGHERPPGGRILLSERATTALRRWWTAPRADAPRGCSLGARLRSERERLGLSQEHVARRIPRRSQGQLSRWEAGDGPLPDGGALAAWMDALDADADLRLEALALAAADHAERTR